MVACLLLAAYAVLSHYSNAVPGAQVLGAMLAPVPLLIVSAVLAWRWARPLTAILMWTALVAILVHFWPLLVRNFSLFYLIQDTALYSVLGITFAFSLLGRRTAVCTKLADRLHGPLSPREVLYTRGVTAAWAAFFFVVAAISIALFLFAPLRIWSIYVNFCVTPLVGAMFAAEYLIRRRTLPRNERAGLLATMRVYLASPQ